jgi:L-arabinonolactonase
MTPEITADRVLTPAALAPNSIGESPVWLPEKSALYWVDISEKRVHAMFADHSTHRWDLPEMVGAIAHMGGDTWLLALASGLYKAELVPGKPAVPTLLAAIEHPQASMRLNDGRCDRQGRFWVSSMHTDMARAAQVGSVYRFGAAGGASPTLANVLPASLIVGNGLAFSAQSTTAYLSDSHMNVQMVWAFDFDAESGTLSNRREFINFKPLAGRPDGAAIDVDDCYWICANDGGAVYRFTPEGRLDRVVRVPAKKPAMCAFGGPRMETLYITSIRPQGVDLADQPDAGCVFAADVQTQGLVEPGLAG